MSENRFTLPGRRKLIALIAVFAVAAGFSAQAIARHLSASRYVPPTILGGVAPKQNAEDVQDTVLDQIGPNGVVEKVTVVPSKADLANVEADIGVPLGPEAESRGAVWIVRAQGNFVARRTPPGVPEARSPRGYYLVDDESGEIIGMGWP
jgi:hypothetical protein